jgi:hypothetical protein
MRYALLLAVALSAASCTPARLAPASEEDRTGATNAVLVCLDRAVTKIDDFQSDAATIAEAAIGMCEPQFLTMDNSYFQQENPYTRQLLSRKAPETHLKIALRSVLENRNRAGSKR